MALKVFARQGIAASSVGAIAATSTVSKATIYKYWPDKDALYLSAAGRDGISGLLRSRCPRRPGAKPYRQ
jgi:TetR/AcrR family transcriptional repressor of mexJK operon